MNTDGSLLWLEINTPHAVPAQEFYSKLFGWHVEPLHSMAFGILPIFKQNNREIGNVFMAMGAFVPSRWIIFLGGDVETIGKKVNSLGGSADENPSVIGGWSKLLGIRDPQNTNTTVIQFFEEKDVPLIAEPGEPYMVELWSQNGSELVNFYKELFQSEVTELEDRWIFKKDGRILHSVTTNKFGDFTQRWIPYFRTNAIRADLRRAQMCGAVTQIPVSEVEGMGELAIMVDPVGGYFGLINPGKHLKT